MSKALELLEKLNSLENDDAVEESAAIYFHRKLHKAGKPKIFAAANKAEIKAFGKDSIVHHDVSPAGITKKTHAIMPSKLGVNGFEHHYIEYHTTGEKAGQVKSKSVTNFATQQAAIDHANKSDLHKLAKKAKDRVKNNVATTAANFLKKDLPSYSKAILKGAAGLK